MASPGFNNPVFSPDPRAVRSYPGAPRTAQYGTPTTPPPADQFGQMGVDAAANAQMEGAFAAPPAGAHQTGRMTIEDTVMKTVLLFAVLLVTAAVGWIVTLGGSLSPANATSLSMGPWLIGVIGGGILGLVNAFKKNPSVPLIVAYAAFEGLFVGGISAYFEFIYPSIIVQATLATVAVVGVTLALFMSGKVRATPRGAKILMIAMIGYLVFSVLNLVLSMTGVVDGWGLRSGWIGIAIGVLVVFMAAYSLVMDFDMVQQGVRNGAPRKFAWQAAFGIMVTVVWLYVEILRMIAILRGSD
ncbi:Bax inhibitor-1/YccA family protein [Microbacterium oryzae]|uniref:Bax inhibitor-1/YccA family protein n=1 Tax=Microbacterium oryzae TaxID=743009 RepID=A0A6I6DR50_9MICO|nr:Bax inhibitor-1/YccA family protein [Microbacterium oryzae]QGU27445.1 Bax inhibitor-1/YccA family protein [Microbacterium oryzae]